MGSKNFDYLGEGFQIQLIHQIVFDKKFSRAIIEVIDVKYFKNKYFKIIVQMIKEYYQKYETTPNFDRLKEISKIEIPQESVLKVVLDMIDKISDAPLEGVEFVQDKALKFCKQEELSEVLKKAEKIINSGEFESYDTLESMVREALQVGVVEDNTEDVFSELEEVLDEDFRHPIPTGIKGIDGALKGGLAKGEIGVILAPTGVGKSLSVSEPVLTPSGWVKNGDIKLGDKVIGSDGKEQYVLGVYPQGVRPIYRVEFTDGTEVYCDREHLWSVNTLNMRTAKTRGKGGKAIYRPNYGYKVVTTGDMMKDIRKRGRYNYRLPVVEPVDFEYREVPIDPYLLGVLIGDGSLSSKQVSFATNDEEIFEHVEHLNEHTEIGLRYRKVGGVGGNREVGHVRIKPDIDNRLEELGLLGRKSNNKFIPEDYLYNSLDVRIDLLQGLMDTDGYVDKKGTNQYTTVSKELCDNVRELVLSLGGTARVSTKIPTYTYNGEKKEGQLAYTVTMSFANDIIPFRLQRKVDRYTKREKYVEQKYVKSITYSHDEEAVCIKVSNADELYVTRDYVLTHNTTIMTKFANNAFNLGYNVLQIFFEDNPKVIKRKHITCWTGIAPDDLPNQKDLVMETVVNIKESMKNRLILKKIASDTVSMSHIKNQVRKLISDGIPIDMVLIDYIDCILPDRKVDDEWKSEGAIMRGFESMCSELNLVGWTATQGNRCVSLDTFVTIKDKGVIQIRDIEVDDHILTHDGYKRVSYVFPIEKQPVYKITTKSGKVIKVSNKHKFPTSDGKVKSIRSGLTIGDILLIKKK